MRLHQARYSQNQGWLNLPQDPSWNDPKTLVFAFCSPYILKDQAPLAQLKQKFSKATLVGCSTSGEIQGSDLSDDGIVVNFCQLEEAHFRATSATLRNPTESQAIGVELANSLNAQAGLKGILVFSDGLNANGSKLIAGFNQIVDPKKVLIGGGLAGDGNHFQQTFIVVDGAVKASAVVAIGFYGETLELRTASKGGWDIFGPERVITKSIGNTLFEIDGRPALELYKEYLGTKASELPASGLLFPMQISPPNDPEKKLVRTILAVSDEAKSLTFAGDVPEGWTAQLMRANFDRVIDGASQALATAYKSVTANPEPELVVAISCVGRRLVLGERCTEELEALTMDLKPESNVIGFYSYGELSPTLEGLPCELHNQTMTLFVIKENFSGSRKKSA